MKSFKSLTLGCTILIASAFYMPAKAQSLEVVFKDILWGIAIGTTVMFVVWATDKEPETNKLGTKLLQGVAYGTGVGFAYETGHYSGSFLFIRSRSAYYS